MTAVSVPTTTSADPVNAGPKRAPSHPASRETSCTGTQFNAIGPVHQKRLGIFHGEFSPGHRSSLRAAVHSVHNPNGKCRCAWSWRSTVEESRDTVRSFEPLATSPPVRWIPPNDVPGRHDV